ncbi:MAG: substrate-binding domain-containing protein [Armatimonadetes bacterium]|nr:substrate-binding domain-containing protein [Armatimonadota bacterium]
MKRELLFGLFIAGLTAIAAGCARSPSAPTASGGDARVWNIGFSQCTLSEPWRVQMNADVKAAAERHRDRINVIFQDAQDDTPTQQAQIKQFVEQGVDLIIISPKESRPFVQPINDAVKKGVPVIVLDRDVPGANYTCFIGGDNKQIGLEAGKFIKQILNGKGNVVELAGLMTSTPAQDRHSGFVEGISGSAIKVIFNADCQWKEPKAQAEMRSALSRFENIDAVYGHNDPSAHGAYLAAKQEGKGRENTIKFVGIDGLPAEGQKYVRDGLLTATFVYPTCGPESIDTALKILDGEKVDKRIILPTRTITKETLK